MNFEKRNLEGLWTVVFDSVKDHRGFLAKPYEVGAYASKGFSFEWRQVIHSRTSKKFTLRGLYVQRDPYMEGKLVVATRGEMYWVVVDLRKGSPTFGKSEGTVLSENKKEGLLIERGFAHGCLSLSDDVDLLLLADNDHSDSHSVGIAWNDPDLAIAWPLDGQQPILSEAHGSYPWFKVFKEQHGGL